jgi:helix-turn-helix protein
MKDNEIQKELSEIQVSFLFSFSKAEAKGMKKDIQRIIEIATIQNDIPLYEDEKKALCKMY